MPGQLEENIVAAAFARYILSRTNLPAGRVARRCCVAQPHYRQVACRRAGPQRWAVPIVLNPKPSVFVDATLMTDFRDAMISNATGFLPHTTAPPAADNAVAVARLGVLPEWLSACLSTPPTPKKRGWW